MASYILTYDVGTSLNIYEQLTAFVKANRFVNQWAQPFIGCFLLKSDAGLAVLNTSFDEFFAGKTLFMLSLINPNETSGRLPPTIWTWLNQPESSLGGLLGPYLGIVPRSDNQ